MYPALVKMVGGKCVMIDTAPNFAIDVEKIAAAITPRTKLILLNSPANPTGVVASEASVKALAELAAEQNIALLERRNLSHVQLRRRAGEPRHLERSNARRRRLQQDVRGHRLADGLDSRPRGDHRQAHHDAAVHVRVCAASAAMGGRGGARDRHDPPRSASTASGVTSSSNGLREAGYEVAPTGGAFYVFPKVPAGKGTGTEFVARAIEKELLIIPGNIFSQHDTHFRISYAASWDTLERGLAVLQELAR